MENKKLNFGAFFRELIDQIIPAPPLVQMLLQRIVAELAAENGPRREGLESERKGS